MDLIALHGWILEMADRVIADGDLDRIERKVAGLAEFPLRGPRAMTWLRAFARSCSSAGY